MLTNRGGGPGRAVGVGPIRIVQRALAGTFALSLVAVGGAVGGTANASPPGLADQDGDVNALILGGARGPFIPWDQITNEVGRGYYPNARRQIVEYPAGQVYGRLPDYYYPSNTISSDSVGQSVDIGARNVTTAIRNSNGRTVVLGNSEGALALNEALHRLAADPNAPDPGMVSFTLYGAPMARTPFSNSFLAAFSPGFHVPLLDYTTTGPLESQYDTTTAIGQYDIVSDFPDRPDNLVALANAALGLNYNHTEVSAGTLSDIPPQNVWTRVNSRGATETYYLVPARQLPLTRPLRDWGVPNDVVDQLDGALKPIVDAGYSRNDYPGAPATGVDPVTRANMENMMREVGNLLPPGFG